MATLTERMLNDTLSDNSNADLCRQCKECIYNSDGTPWSSHYTKSYCAMYSRPMRKPDGVIHNSIECEYRET